VYSPKIDEKHIPVLYKLSKTIKKPMTHLVNEAVTEYLVGKGGVVRIEKTYATKG
jgi:hypothetical protein